jgi:2-oxoglutarate/2-oxoacid ferredoxin oxidoreductase subunit alpha
MEITNQFSWMIGGPQGTGVDSSATLFIRSCAVAGLNVYGKREYHSNIMGEHSYFQVRVSESPVHSHVDPVHLLASFDDETARIHAHEVVSGGYFFYDANVTKPETLDLAPGVITLALPYSRILEEVSAETGQPLAKLQIMKNTIAVAASLALTDFEIQYIEKALKGIFTGSKAKLVPMNMKVAEKAYAFIQEQGIKDQYGYRLKSLPSAPPRMIMNGSTAVALGKLKAGCRFQSYYPITPASDESTYLESHPEYGVNVVQCEDEIAAMCMAVGAALTGVRAATSSSGPGFGLKAEGLGWAGINEVPVVVFNYQRGGPSTGLPTRHEQGDLLYSLFIGHGEFPKIVVAPGDMTEMYMQTFNAFNYADQFQTPVIMICDKALANNTATIAPYDESQLKINRGKIATQEYLNELAAKPEYKGEFHRFAESEDGVSTRSLPGQENGIYWCTGDEHDTLGHISEDPDNRIMMHEKRMRKLPLASNTIPKNQQWELFGPEDAEITIVTWGSTKGPVLDAMPILQSDGVSMNVLQIKLMSPFPVEDVTRILNKAKVRIGVEQNFVGQLSKLVRMETGIKMDHMVVKYTGRPMSETEVVTALREIANKQSEKVVLHYGH